MSLPIEVNPNMLGGGGYQISRSVRLRSSASAYFNRTPGSAGNRKTWTWSAWVKRGALGALQSLFGTTGSSTDTTFLWFGFNSSDKLTLSLATAVIKTSTQVFRDPSACYHIIVSFDSTQATGSNRIRFFVNGQQVTAFDVDTAPTQNVDYGINLAQAHFVSTYNGSGYPFDGYLTEINFIDGQALTPSSFGETNPVTGVWQPKKYSGTYGTNGFYLNFSDNSGATATTIGKDYSGNGNNWTPNNISVTSGSTYDSMLDTPTPYADGGNGRGNYATLNPVNYFLASGVTPTTTNTLQEGNLYLPFNSASAYSGFNATISAFSGKWYFEATTVSGGSGGGGGLGLFAGTSTTFITNSGLQSTSYAVGSVLAIAFDCDAGTGTTYVNNSVINNFTFTAGSAITINAYVGNSPGLRLNFGQRPFTYTPPSGYKALNTQNLPAPTIAAGAQHMAATLYTGTGSSLSVANTTTNFSFQPDFVWIKSRSAATDHALYDAVRGVQKQLESNNDSVETTETTGLTAFNSNGFTVGSLAQANTNAATYVAWQWKANGAGVTNTAGSVTSTVSANTTAGFSVVTFTAGTTSPVTVGHGLGVVPAMFITKPVGTVGNWSTYHKSLGATQGVRLNTTDGAVTSQFFWNNTAPTSTIITGYFAGTGSTLIYCFAEIAGFSAFGSYTGNGSTDGPFIYTGFRPRWILYKRTNSTGNWYIQDTSRDPSNVSQRSLLPNLPNVEYNGGGNEIDVLSNGFKFRTLSADQNGSGGAYIYAAFAENPFKYALAR